MPKGAVITKAKSRRGPTSDRIAGHASPRAPHRTAVRGRIVAIDCQAGLHFTLEEAPMGPALECWPSEEHRELLARCWAEQTWIIVEGTLAADGKHRTLTHLTQIMELPPGDKGGWRGAMGAAPRPTAAARISSAQAVRKVRDAHR